MQTPYEQDTIAAIATPPGRGGIGIVRLSGPQSRTIAEPILRLRNPLAPGRTRFAEILDPTTLTTVLDEAVVTYFQAPNSYTCEDLVEIALHGAPVLLEAVLRYTLNAGARLAEPGEFTQRAFLSGRIDLTAAEAVRDLIDAHTLHQVRVAAAQLGGSISRTIDPIKRQLLTLIAALEAGIDFAEDDLDLLPLDQILAQLVAVTVPLRTLAASFRFGRILRNGFTIALVGQPNAGKSSLFNALLGRDRAIVTPHPGTTRDLITEQFALAGVPVELIDTAGLRDLTSEPAHEAERAGIARTRTTLAEAHHVLLIVDTTQTTVPTLSPADTEVLTALGTRPVTLVLNKCDQLTPHKTAALIAAFPAAALVSATTGAGLEQLREILVKILTATAPAADATLITNVRQQHALERALTSLETARSAALTVPHEMLLLDLYAALASLDDLTGATPTYAILNEIFSTFCIGK